ncbi:AraC family transcriptional regulator [Mesorhizobium sp. RP14(2022)]|uniref:AraC family transcriptional regulator n=1 Tax=Mesorhizobium liriopis TaxID=2953882 RepID=A0ABT1C3U3_9HYPH|nr:AraC family transcriptional regulator [Mesorhizobium liriopis]MCO6049318.1 AraC family transcriptional regulator [Mesorhizobium liriopis]
MGDAFKVLRDYALSRATGVLTRTPVPRLDILRVAAPTKLFPEVYQPLVSLILHGEKRLVIGDQVVCYGAGDAFVSAVDLPVAGEVVAASPAAPYLALRLVFDCSIVADLVSSLDAAPLPDIPAFGAAPVDDRLIDAWLRFLRLSEEPEEVNVLAPLLEREILFRLLRGRHGSVLRQAADLNGRISRIGKAVSVIRANYAEPFRVEDLARQAGMSVSAFHRSFKAVTGLSPLRYQKHLRLYAARRMLFVGSGAVAMVAFSVGYESASQFTREYTRLFGIPPTRDVRKLHARTAPNLAKAA